MIKGTCIAVTSGKGGVGKSTVSANLAYQLAQQGKRVAIIDADIYGFSIPKLFDIKEKPKIINEKIMPVTKHDVQIISMEFFMENNEAVVWRGPMLGKMLQHFLQDVLWGDLDYAIFDLPPGTGDIALDVHLLLPHCKEILVTTPHPAATHVAERAGAMAVKTSHEILGVVENMSSFTCPVSQETYYLFGKGGGKQLADRFQVPLLASIPIRQPDPNNSAGAAIHSPASKIGKIYGDMAQKMIEALHIQLLV